MPKTKTTTSTQDELMAQINKVYPGALTKGNDPDLEVTRIPTGVLPLDYILDGGLPRGRFIEVFGGYSTLKSYWLYKALGSYQKRGKKVALIDTEHSFDPVWGAECGIDVDDLYVARPTTAEEAFGVIEILIRQKYDLFGFDSIAAAQPKQYAEAMPGDDNAPGALARVMSRGLARLVAANKHTTGIFLNQQRSTIGITFGPKQTTSGGRAMGYYASYRLSFVRTGKITEPYKQWDGDKYIDAKRVLAHKVQATLEKSKLSAPYADTHFVFDLRTGEVDENNFLIALGVEKGLITKSSAGHYRIEGVLDKPIHGADNFRQWVDDNEEVTEWLKSSLIPDAN